MQPLHLIIKEKFHEELMTFICKKVNHADYCQDILQEVYLKILTNREKISNAQNIRSYVFRMAANVVMDYFRQTARQRTKEQVFPVEGEASKENNRLVDIVKPMIDALPPIYRRALILSELEGLTQPQLAHALGISLSAAKSRVQRARRKLRDEILACCAYKFDRYGNVISCCENRLTANIF